MRNHIAVRSAVACLLASVGARAASFTWTQLSSGNYNWSTAANWAGGNTPPVGGAADASVVLWDSATQVSAGARISATNDLGVAGTFNLNNLSIRGWSHNSGSSQSPASFGSASYHLQGATLNFIGTSPTVYFHPSVYAAVSPSFYAGNPYVDVNNNVNLSADTRFYTPDGNTATPGLRVNGTVSGPGRLTWDNQEYTGSFNMALSGPNTFTGGVTVGNAGSNRAYLLIASDASLGAVPGAAVADNLRLAGRIQPLNTGDLTLNANRGVTLFGPDPSGGFIGPSANTGWLISGGKITGAKTLQLSGNVRLTGSTSDFGVPGTIGTSRGLWTADTSVDVAKLADEGQPYSLGSYGKLWFDGGGGGTLRYLGTGDSTNRTVAGDKNMVFDAAGSGPITYTGLLDWSAGGGVTFTGAGSGVSSGTLNLAGNHTLAKSGVGDWTLGGTVNLTGNTSATTLSNGKLTLDYRAVNADKINSAAALTMGSAGATATLAIQGSNSLDTVQKVTTGTTLTADSGSIFNVTSSTGAQNASLVLVALTRGVRSTVEINCTNPGTGTAAVTTTTANNAAGILGGWAVVNGSDWGRAGTANVNGGNNIVALAAYTGALPTTGGVTTDNDTLGASQAQTGAATINSLKISDSGASQSLDLNGNNVTFTSTSGGLLYVGGTSNSFTVKNTGALAYIGGGTANEFLVNVKSGTALDIGARLIGNATAGALVKFGGGTLVVSNGANNYTGGTTVTSGTLKLGVANAIPSSGSFTLGTGTTFDLAGFGVTTGNVQGFGTITNSSASDVLFTIGNTTNNLTFGGVIQDGATNKVSVALNGQAQNLAGLNTYTGATTVNGGTLNVTNLADGGQVSGIGRSSNAAANLVLNGGTFGYTGTVNATTDRNLTLNTTGGGLSSNSATASVAATFNGNIAPTGVAASRTLTLTGSSIGVLNGTTADFGVGNVTALTKSAGGTWVLNGANGYTGMTTVNGGVLRANDGVGLPTASPMTISAGVFETGADLTRTLGAATGNVRVSGGTSGFSANGTAPVTVAIGGTGSPTALTWGTADFAPTTLVLNETTANQNLTFANPVDLNAATRTVNVNATTGGVSMTGVLSNSSGTAGLTKGGAGVLVLTNNNSSFNGKTTVNLGMLSFTSIGNVAAGNSALGNPSDSTTGTIALGSGANTAALQYLGPTASTNRVIDLAGTTGGVMIESSGSGPLTFTNAFTATGNGAKTLYLAGNTGGKIQGAIVNSTGTTAVAKSGTGVWELSGANAFTGGLTVRSGVLRAREASIPSTGGLTLNGSNPNNLASVWESDQDIIRGVNATPTAGNLLLTTTNGYAPVGFSARGGNINVNLGSGTALTWGSSGFLGNQQRFLLNESTADSAINFQNSLSFNAQGPANVFIVVNAASADATAATMSGVLSSGGLTKQGPGLLILANAANSFVGGLTIQEGTLRVGTAGALPNSNTLIVTAGTLDLATAGVSTTAASLTLGGGAAGTAATVATGSGTLTLGGTLTYNGSTANDNGATVSGNLSLTADRNFTINDSLAAANDLTISAAISSTGVFGVIKNNAGTLLLSGANSYTGGTSDTGGDLRIGGASGALTGTSGITLSGVGTRFTIDNSAAVSSSRVRDVATVSLGVGTDFRLVGGAGGSVNETIGAMGLSDGHMTISLTAVPTTGAALTFASINRPYGQTLLTRGSNLGQGTVGTAGVANLLFTDATGITTNYFKGGTGTPLTTQKVITFMVGDTSPTGMGSDLVTYDANGVRALSLAAGEYTTTITDGQTQLDNVRVTSPVSLANSSTINALLVGTGGGVTIASGKTLTINSGVITPVGDNVSISGGTITSANTVIVNASRDMTISSAINGQLYKGGFATLTLAGPLTGIDRLHTGVLRMGAANVLPPTGSLSASAGTLLFDLNGYDQTIAGNGGWTMQVSNTSATYATLTTTSGLQGTITGNLNIKYTGTGTLAINGGSANNAWTGTTQATDGTVSMSGGHYFSPWSVFRLGDTDGSSGKLDIVNGADMTIAGLTVVGGTTNTVTSTTSGTRILTVRTLGSDWSFPGIIKPTFLTSSGPL